MALSPFGSAVRHKALDAYLASCGDIGTEDAWEHIYRLLLSIEPRTGLAHIYDANHMQPTGGFYTRAQTFTALLADHWNILPEELGQEVDHMFRFCVDRFRREGGAAALSDRFADRVRSIVSRRLGPPPEMLELLVADLTTATEDFFVMGRKRQNVRGEGFEDVLLWLLANVGNLPASRLRARAKANALPGFRPRPSIEKVPKPDIAVLSPTGSFTSAILTVKWSLRQDRLDQFGQEWSYYRGNRQQDQEVEFHLITNEFDTARLNGVLNPPAGAGGFHFRSVYHVNVDFVAAVQDYRFGPLQHYVQAGRLKSIRDLLMEARNF